MLAVASAFTVFSPSLTREGRAKKHYLDGWFSKLVEPWISDDLNIEDVKRDNNNAAVWELEAALELSPGNSLYEQALVWKYPAEKLPVLLKGRKLGTKARLLAADKIYKYEDEKHKQPTSFPGMPTTSKSQTKQLTEDEILKKKLTLLDDLQKADPTNALVHYRKAVAYKNAGKLENAAAEIRIANRMDETRWYLPEVSPEVANTGESPIICNIFSDNPRFRELARMLSDMASERLRHGKVDDAVGLLEDCCQMGVNIASTKPRTLISFLVGRAIFSIGWAKLEPIYKDFGMKEKLQDYRKLDQAFRRGQASAKAWIGSYGFQMGDYALKLVTPMVLALSPFMAVGVLILVFVWWIPSAIARKVKRETALTLPPWNYGWMSRIFASIYIPVFAIMFATITWKSSLISFAGYPIFDYPGRMPIVVAILAQLVLVGVTLRILHHRSDEHFGQRTGIFRFIFKAPAAVKFWTRKYVMAALAASLLFLGCCFMLTVILYKPIVGAHPWQMNRFPVGMMLGEEAVVDRAIADLNKSLEAHKDYQIRK